VKISPVPTTSSPTHPSNNSKVLGLAIGIPVGLCCLITVVAAAFAVRLRQQGKRRDLVMMMELDQKPARAVNVLEDDQLELYDIQIREQLGAGNFGQVRNRIFFRAR
jgi:hypothetical protein